MGSLVVLRVFIEKVVNEGVFLMTRSFSRMLIKDNSRNILVVQDRDNLWNFPGGKKEAGETPLHVEYEKLKKRSV